MKSDTIGQLAKALAAAQAELKPAELNSSNPFFNSRYADLGAIIEALKQPFAKNGLSYTQIVITEDDKIGLETLLMHASGEWISSTMFLPFTGQNKAQAAGSVITYLRRYCLAAIAGVYAGDDDDGNASEKVTAEKPKKSTKHAVPLVSGPDEVSITLEEAENITAKDGRRYGDIESEELSYHLNGITEALAKKVLPASKWKEFLTKQAAAKLILKTRAEAQ